MKNANSGSIVKNVLLAAASTLFVLFLVEAALRAAYYIKDHRGGTLQERLEDSRRKSTAESGKDFNLSGLVRASPFKDVVYELKPNVSGTFRGKPIRTNSYGMRGRELEADKGDGLFRVAGLGDSVMFGWGVGQDDFYLEVLERKLNDIPGSRMKFETMNFAVPGYNSAIQAAVLEHKALPLEPDLVIVHFVSNDFGVPIFMQKPRDILTLKKSYLADFLGERLGRAAPEERTDLTATRGESRAAVLEEYHYMTGTEGFRKAMKKLARLAARRDIPVIFAMGSTSGGQARIVRKTARRLGFEMLKVGPYVDDYLEKHHIENSPEARRKVLWVAPKDHHPNAVGHGIWAEALLDKIGKMGLLGSKE